MGAEVEVEVEVEVEAEDEVEVASEKSNYLNTNLTACLTSII